jgi:hypothetical protein
MRTLKEIFELTYSQMDNVFSSNEFSICFVRNGGRKSDVDKGNMLFFLKQNALPYGNSEKRVRTWCKKPEHVKQSNDPIELKEQECIDFLKSKGYKITITKTIEL